MSMNNVNYETAMIVLATIIENYRRKNNKSLRTPEQIRTSHASRTVRITALMYKIIDGIKKNVGGITQKQQSILKKSYINCCNSLAIPNGETGFDLLMDLATTRHKVLIEERHERAIARAQTEKEEREQCELECEYMQRIIDEELLLEEEYNDYMESEGKKHHIYLTPEQYEEYLNGDYYECDDYVYHCC